MWMPGVGNCSREIGLMSDLGVASGKPALVLLHPFLVSGKVWQDVVPRLSSYHQVFTPTALGHSGGPPVQRRPVTIWDVIDAAEEYLNEHGLERPHLAGNSMGGFVALELARRGRAATVCALSPAGFWSTGDGSRPRDDGVEGMNIGRQELLPQGRRGIHQHAGDSGVAIAPRDQQGPAPAPVPGI